MQIIKGTGRQNSWKELQELYSEVLPPEVAPCAKVPAPKLLPLEDDALCVSILLDAYRRALDRHNMPYDSRAYTGAQILEMPKYKALKRILPSIREYRIRPDIWCEAAVRFWCEYALNYRGTSWDAIPSKFTVPKGTPTVGWVYSQQRIDTKFNFYDTFEKEAVSRRFVYPEETHKLTTTFDDLKTKLLTADHLDSNTVKSIVQTIFPGNTYTKLVQQATFAAEVLQDRIDQRAERGEYIWST